MIKTIIDYAATLKEELSALRRDFHKYPELAFCEFRTSSKIINYLKSLGFEVKYGNNAIDMNAALGVPDHNCLSSEIERARSEGAPENLLETISNGATGVIGEIIGNGKVNGKTVAFRFDIDAVGIEEAREEGHAPYDSGFSSVHKGCAHCCGHDGHIAIGLGLAKLLSENRDCFSGRVRLIFQPAEEGVKGAGAMVSAGAAEGVDYLFSGHIGMSAKRTGSISVSTGAFLCAAKYDAEFFGLGAHAGVAPEEGKNALLAAAHATLALHGISRHGGGASRVNVGVINGGTGRNVIPDYAKIQFETRGENDKINEYMSSTAKRVVSAAASMFDVQSKIELVGFAGSYTPDDIFAKQIYDLAEKSGLYNDIIKYSDLNASEDCSEFLNYVDLHGGKTSYMLFGTQLKSAHHTPNFDFDEETLHKAVAFLAILAYNYS